MKIWGIPQLQAFSTVSAIRDHSLKMPSNPAMVNGVQAKLNVSCPIRFIPGKIAYGRRRTEKVAGTDNTYRLVKQENYIVSKDFSH